MKTVGLIKKFPKDNIGEKLQTLLSEIVNTMRMFTVSVNLKRIVYYLRIWIKMSKNSFMIVLSHKTVFSIFLLGKIIRFVFFAGFVFFLVKGAERLAGYDVNQAIFFFLTFNLIEITAGFLFREVYRFRSLIISGDFDLVLVKPMSALFRVLMGGADIIDLVTIPPIVGAIYYFGGMLDPSLSQVVYYLVLVVNGLIIACALYIFVLSVGIMTIEIDHSIMILRDVVNLGRFPVDIYKQPLRGFITYFIPVGVMITLPAKALMGLVSGWGVFFSFIFGMGLILLARGVWSLSLTKYTSASS